MGFPKKTQDIDSFNANDSTNVNRCPIRPSQEACVSSRQGGQAWQFRPVVSHGSKNSDPGPYSRTPSRLKSLDAANDKGLGQLEA